METKSFEVHYTTQAQGKFAARILAWNKPDSMGDIFRSGAFLDSIDRWQKKARKIPVIFNHKWDDIFDHVGDIRPEDVFETAAGLEVQGSFYLAEETARKVFTQLERRALSEWSMGFTIQQAKPLPKGGREITQAHLLECGPCLKGAGDTQTISVKAEEARRLTAAERAELLERHDLDARRRQLASVQLAPHRQHLDLVTRQIQLEKLIAQIVSTR